MEKYGWADDGGAMDDSDADEMQCDNLFGIHPFYIEKGSYCINLFQQLNVCWLSFCITPIILCLGEVVAWWVVLGSSHQQYCLELWMQRGSYEI